MEKQNNEALELDVKFKVRDILRYNMSVALKNIVNDIVLGVGLASLIYFFYRMSVTEQRLDIFVAQNITFIIVPILIYVLIPGRVWKITLSQMQMPAFAQGVKYIFTKDHITLDIGEASDEMKWDIFIKIIETKKDFRFYINKVSAQIVPKHNMNKEQIEVLKAIIKEATDTSVYNLK